MFLYICTTAKGSRVGIAPRAQTRAQHSFVGAWLLSEADIAASLAPLAFFAGAHSGGLVCDRD
jgi:hypothetical protein